VNEIDTDNVRGDNDDAIADSPNWTDPKQDAAGKRNKGLSDEEADDLCIGLGRDAGVPDGARGGGYPDR
jgi:hypothetical protein